MTWSFIIIIVSSCLLGFWVARTFLTLGAPAILMMFRSVDAGGQSQCRPNMVR
jgi:hypothetical protein